LGYFEELNEQVLLVYTAVADTELHEQVFELDLRWVIEGGHSHCVHPESESLVKVLSFCQAVVQQSYAHLQDD
jgi:hypothetical protein